MEVKISMKKVLVFIFGCALLCACNNQAKLEKEAEAKYEQEAKARALAEQEEWNKIKTLALKAAGVTSSVREERKLAYVKLIQIFPKSERWSDIDKSIEKDEVYTDYDDFLWEIKKAKGWEEIE